MKITNSSDFFVGLFCTALAALGFWLGGNLRVGTATNMGPGYMPLALCWILLGFGGLLLARGLLTGGEGRVIRLRMRALVFISASIACFALAITPLGLVATVILLVATGSLADPESRPWETALLGVGMAIFCSLVFVKGLGLPMYDWPEGFR